MYKIVRVMLLLHLIIEYIDIYWFSLIDIDFMFKNVNSRLYVEYNRMIFFLQAKSDSYCLLCLHPMNFLYSKQFQKF